MTNAVANTQPTNVYEIVERQESQFASVLSTEAISWNKESQFAMQLLQANDFLNKTAWNNQSSLKNAIINIASIGISLNPALKHAYLVPRGGAVCLDISFMGILSIAQKSGSIVWGQAKLVYANDKYVNTGVDTAPTHKQQTFGDKGVIVGVYCTVKLPSGDYLTEEMDMATIDKIKNASKAKDGPWKTWPEEMMRKAVVKRGSKYWPDTERLSATTDMLNKQEGNEEAIQPTSPNTGEFTSGQKEYLDQLIEKGDALEMYVFSSSFDLTDASGAGANVWISLMHSFEKGQKGKYQDIVKALKRSGEDIFNEYLTSIESKLGVDDIAVAEIVEGMTTDTLKLIESKLNPEMIMEFNKVVSNASH